MPKKDEVRWIDLPYDEQRENITVIRNARTTAEGDSVLAGRYTRQVMFFIAGNAVVGTNMSAAPTWRGEDGETKRIDAECKTAPTGAALQMTVKAGGVTVGTVTIAAAATSGATTALSVSEVVNGDVCRLDVGQIGSTVAGADITVVLETECRLET